MIVARVMLGTVLTTAAELALPPRRFGCRGLGHWVSPKVGPRSQVMAAAPLQRSHICSKPPPTYSAQAGRPTDPAPLTWRQPRQPSSHRDAGRWLSADARRPGSRPPDPTVTV